MTKDKLLLAASTLAVLANVASYAIAAPRTFGATYASEIGSGNALLSAIESHGLQNTRKTTPLGWATMVDDAAGSETWTIAQSRQDRATWGAIAVEAPPAEKPRPRICRSLAVGYSSNQSSTLEAISEAIFECETRAQGAECDHEIDFKACGAYAQGFRDYGSGLRECVFGAAAGSSRTAAERDALQNCRFQPDYRRDQGGPPGQVYSCRIEHTVCNDQAETAPLQHDVLNANRNMWAVKRSNLRSGPGTEFDRVGLLEVGEPVLVTGEIGEWFRIQVQGKEAFVYAPLLTAVAPAGSTSSSQDTTPGKITFEENDIGEGPSPDTGQPGSVTITWDDGERNEGESPEPESGACLSVERHSKTTATWVNRCRVGIDVIWRDEGACRSTDSMDYTCGWYVRPNDSAAAAVEGRVWWHECRSPNGRGDVVAVENIYGEAYCLDDPSRGTMAGKERQYQRSRGAERQAAELRQQEIRESEQRRQAPVNPLQNLVDTLNKTIRQGTTESPDNEDSRQGGSTGNCVEITIGNVKFSC